MSGTSSNVGARRRPASASRAGGASDRRPIGAKVPLLNSFGEDAAGHVYVTSQSGAVYRIVSR